MASRSMAAAGWGADTYLSLAILAVALSTLLITYPRPAKLDLDRLTELDEYTADLLFFLYPWPNPHPTPPVPRDYLLQLRVAVANVGRRNAVVSTIAIEHFVTESGKTMFLPEAVQGPIWGSRWNQQFGYVGGHPVMQEVSSPGPFVLGPDEVIVITFRSRRGIDWSDRWDLGKVRSFYDDLSDRFVSARVSVAWRRASWWRSAMKLRTDSFLLNLKVLHQDDYLEAIKEQTSDFTLMPAVEAQPIAIE